MGRIPTAEVLEGANGPESMRANATQTMDSRARAILR